MTPLVDARAHRAPCSSSWLAVTPGARCSRCKVNDFSRSTTRREDELVQVIPTVVIKELGFDKTRGFPVINRPWTLMQVSRMPLDHPLFISLMVACSGSSGPTLRSGSPRTMCTLPRRITCCGSAISPELRTAPPAGCVVPPPLETLYPPALFPLSHDHPRPKPWPHLRCVTPGPCPTARLRT